MQSKVEKISEEMPAFGTAVRPGRVVVLATGGTIAGTARQAVDNIGYTAAQLGVDELVSVLPTLANTDLEAEQVMQIDSKDMEHAQWMTLARRVVAHLKREEVCGIVITHGTDTLEETAYFLQRVLAPVKPVVITAAMRPATSLQADGPQNMLDAIGLARMPGVRGVVVAVGGQVHSSFSVRKTHTYHLDPYGSGDAGVIGYVEEGRLRQLRDWPQGEAIGLDALPADTLTWPTVEIITSHAGAGGALVWQAVASGVRGLVVAATGNGTVHHALLTALLGAQLAGVKILRSSRCLDGPVLPRASDSLPSAGMLTPVQARVELLLQLMGAKPAL